MRLRHWVPKFVLLGLFLAAVFPVEAATAKPAEPTKEASKPSQQASNDLGLVFNATLTPLDLQAYQAGVGFKMGIADIDLRGLVDVVLSSASDSFSLKLGVTAEYHLTPEPYSFYLGGSCTAGFMLQTGSYSSFIASLGAVAGVEYFPLKFLSVFAEYALAVDLTWTTNLSTSETTFDYLVDTRMGNESKIGIVIYFQRLMGK